jgi:type II secretory pathway pseudopilin PulG
MEVLLTAVIMLVVLTATLYSLGSTTRTQARYQSYAQEITNTQGALAHLVHDLREATQVVFVTPDKLEFKVPLKVDGTTTTWTVLYDCTASDSLGSGYTRCARTQSSTGSPPAAGPTARSEDIQHVWNNASRYWTFCNSSASGPSGAVFYISNSNIPNTDGSTAACDETYETELGLLVNGAQFVQIQVAVPASGNLTRYGMTHRTVLSTGTFVPNLSAGA